MAFVNRKANWGAQAASAHETLDKPRKNVAADRSNHLVPVDHSVLRRPANRDESPTTEIVELAEAHDVIVLAVTTDPALRAALTEVLPRDGVVLRGRDSRYMPTTSSAIASCLRHSFTQIRERVSISSGPVLVCI